MKQRKKGHHNAAMIRQRIETASRAGDWKTAISAADELRRVGTCVKEDWNAICTAYIDGGSANKAMEATKAYLNLFGKSGTALFFRGHAFMMSGKLNDAERSFRAALKLTMPTGLYGALCSILATLLRDTARPEEAPRLYIESIKRKNIATGILQEYSNYLFNLHYLDLPQDIMLEAAKGYGKLLSAAPKYEHSRERHRHEKLRIGYISTDLYFHVVAFFSYALLKRYDHSHFEVYCYTDAVEDAASAEFKAGVDKWTNVRGMGYQAIAQLIYDDEIDILFDLSGHTAGGRLLPILAYKPAPVQISGIGYFDTTGLESVDYFLADKIIDPPENDKYFTESLLRLPQSHFCYMWHDNPRSLGEAPHIRNGYITFGSLNNFTKVNKHVLGAWKRILDLVPGSRLHLRAGIFDNEDSAKIAKDMISDAGIDLTRVTCLPRSSEYLNDYANIDIALDTFPYPGGGTTCDALYMGVPVITLAGERHNARFGLSLLHNVGLDECCAYTEDEYVERAVQLASSPMLDKLHTELRDMLKKSPVMDADIYMHDIESAYRKIWDIWCTDAGDDGIIQQERRPYISAVWIVKDEADELSRSIKSVSMAADEMIVVMTADVPEVRKSAEALGADVYTFRWNGSFSAARNFALSKAHGQWIIFLDADEYFDEASGERICDVLSALDEAADVPDMLMIPRTNLEKDGSVIIEDESPRILRNVDGLHYEGDIHEEPRLAGGTLLQMVHVPRELLRIFHTGYMVTRRDDKARRNLELLMKDLHDGSRPAGELYMYIAEAFMGLGQKKEAEHYARLDINQGRRAVQYASRSWHILLEILAGDTARFDERVKAAEQAVRDFPELPEFHAELALCRAARGDYKAAVDEMQEALSISGKDTGLEPVQFDADMALQASHQLEEWKKKIEKK